MLSGGPRTNVHFYNEYSINKYELLYIIKENIKLT